MGEEYIQKTQQTLGTIIKKPPLTDKLLSKPPFRFLHDIITAVIRTTKFMDGLYTEAELNSENIADRDAKIDFLQKAVDVVQIVNGEPLEIRPAKTVAGSEPDKTNEFLQALAAAINKTKNTQEIVHRVLNGEKPDFSTSGGSAGSNKENRETTSSERQKSKTHKDKETEKDTKRRPSSADKRSKGKHEENDKKKHDEGGKDKREKSKDKEVSSSKHKEKTSDKEPTKDSKNSAKDGSKERSSSKHRDKESSAKDKETEKGSNSKHKTSEKEKEKDKKKEKEKDKPSKDVEMSKDKKSRSASGKERRSSVSRPRTAKQRSTDEEPPPSHFVNGDSGKTDHHLSDNEGDDEIMTSKNVGKASESPKRPAQSAKDGQRMVTEEEPVGKLQRQAHSARPTTGARPGTAMGARPGTALGARPGTALGQRPPPRIKRTDTLPDQDHSRVDSAKPSTILITDSGSQKKGNDDDDFIIEDGGPSDMDIILGHAQEVGEDAEDLNAEEHGGLVRKILETKKELEANVDLQKGLTADNRSGLSVVDAKDREKTKKEAAKLQEQIQQLTRNAHPLGKMTDYLQEDVDSMLKELEQYRAEYRENLAKLRQEHGGTDGNVLDPLRAKLVDYDQQIKDQQEAISTMKATVLHNQEKINQFMNNVVKK